MINDLSIFCPRILNDFIRNNNVSRVVPYPDFSNPIKPDWSNIHWQYPNQSFFLPKRENISPLCLNLVFIFPACRSAGKVEPSVELQVDLSLDTPPWENVNPITTGWTFYFSISRPLPLCGSRWTCYPANHLHAPWWTSYFSVTISPGVL